MASFSVAESGAPLPQLLLRLLTFPILPPIGHHSYQCLRGRSPPTSYILCSASHWLATSKTRYVFFAVHHLLYLLPRIPRVLGSPQITQCQLWSSVELHSSSFAPVRLHILHATMVVQWPLVSSSCAHYTVARI